MGLFNFFRTEKPVGFTYRPRYYNEDKNELEKKLREAREARESDDPDKMKERIRRDLRRKGRYKGNKSYRQQRMARSNIMLLIIIVILIMVTYAALELYLPAIVKYFE